MSIKHPELKNPVPANLHEMIREKCEEYFDELEENFEATFGSLEDLESLFEEDIAAIGKMVLAVHYQEDYDRFVRELKETAAKESNEEE